MVRSTMDFAEQNTERAAQATNWMCAVAEQNLIQNKAVFEGLLTIARNTLRSIDQQSSAISEHSIAVAEQALSNAFDFSHKVLRIKDPQELAQIQSELISRQAQVLGNHSNELGQRVRVWGARYSKDDNGRNFRISEGDPRLHES